MYICYVDVFTRWKFRRAEEFFRLGDTDVFISRWNWRFLRDSMRLIYLTFRRSWTSSNRKLKLNYNFCFYSPLEKARRILSAFQNSSCSRNFSTSTFDSPRIGYSHIPTYFWYIWTRRETAYCALTIVNPGSLINQESMEIPFSLGCSRRYYYAERREAVVICQTNVKQNSPISNRRTIKIHGEWLAARTHGPGY